MFRGGLVRGAVGLTVANDGLLIERVGRGVVEESAGWDEGVGDGLVGCLAGADFDARWVDALLLDEVLAFVEGALGGESWLLAWGLVADDDQAGIGLLAEGEGNVVEAAFGFVVDAHGTFGVAREADAAEVLGRWRRRHGRSGEDDVGGGGQGVVGVVGHGAGNGDGAGAEAGGRELGGGSGAVDDAGGCGVGVGEGAVLRACAGGGNVDVGAGDGGGWVGQIP